MKKIFSTLILSIFLLNIQNCYAAIEVLPTMYSRSNAQDKVWVASFQLVWDDFINKVVFNPVRFREGTPMMVHELNMQSFNEDDLSEKSYYKMCGKVNKNTKKQITKAIKKKFKETSDLLDKLDLTPRNDMLIVYAMLKKDFEFLNEFDKLERSLFGQDQIAEYFGISGTSKKALDNGVKVLFYNSPVDFAVLLTTNGDDEVYLYRNSANKSFSYLYGDMLKKQFMYKGDREFKNVDELKVPNIKFFEEKSFDKLANKRIMGTNLVINQAMETIKFNMNNKGVKLKSEAALTVMTTSLAPEVTPRNFYFDDTFVIFLKEKGKKNPYFALRVNDISNYQ